MGMARILALFDTKSNATAALDRIYDQFKNDDQLDVRVYDSSDLTSGEGRVSGRAVPLPISGQQGVIPVTGSVRGMGLNSDEQRFFTDRMGQDSVFTIIETNEGSREEITDIVRGHNGQVYEER
jgi:hypothetical protein